MRFKTVSGAQSLYNSHDTKENMTEIIGIIGFNDPFNTTRNDTSATSKAPIILRLRYH